MDRPLVAIVLAGGTGTRLYPASRSCRPKQFLTFGGENSLLARTVDRCQFADETIVLTRERFAERVRDHAPDVTVWTEPAGKDTGPAVTFATRRCRERFDDCVVLAMPSDHRICDEFSFVGNAAGEVAATTEKLVTIGVEPERAATGYGYIEPGDERRQSRDIAYHDVEQFHEKPPADAVQRYVAAGWLWNAGIFAWTPAAFFTAVRDSRLAPLASAATAEEFDRAYRSIPPVSVDHAVIEPTAQRDGVVVMPTDIEWEDVGSWDAVGRVLETDDAGNAIESDGLTIEAANNVVVSDDYHVSVVDVDGLVVVAYDDRILVVPRSAAQRVRAVVEQLQADGRF